jgi:hypothetical protein
MWYPSTGDSDGTSTRKASMGERGNQGAGLSPCMMTCTLCRGKAYLLYCELYGDSGELVINVQQEGKKGRNEHAEV